MHHAPNHVATLVRMLSLHYTAKSDVPPEVLRQSMDERVIQALAAQEAALAMLIWFFMQLYAHWIIPAHNLVDESFCPPISLATVIVERLLQMLAAIERGQLTVTPQYNPNEPWTEIPYTVSNGWVITVYSRLCHWHRVETFTTPDGIEFDPWLIPEAALHDRIFDYDPPVEVQRRIYGFHQVS